MAGPSAYRATARFFLIAKGRVHTGSIDTHGLRQIGERGAFKALLPEDFHCGLKRLTFGEAEWTPHLRVFCHSVRSIYRMHLWIE